MKLAITGGGTGGHVSPGLAVARVWRDRHGDDAVIWAGRRGGIEERMAGAAGIAFHAVDAAGITRAGARSAPLRVVMKNLAAPFHIGRGIVDAFRLMGREKPGVVLMTGGFAGAPLALAAGIMGKPLVLIEPNAAMGLANKFFRGAAGAVCLGFDVKGMGDNAVHTGNPVRFGKALPPRALALRRLGLKAGMKTLLVMPGSTSAQSVTKAMAQALPKLKGIQVVWMTGEAMKGEAEAAMKKAGAEGQVFAFIDDVVSAYAAADLVLARSGASMVAEIACAAKPSVLVPYPYAAGDHQRKNAMYLVEAGAARMISDAELSGERLGGEITALMKDPKRLKAMGLAAKKIAKPDAAREVASVLERVARGFDHV